jgi:epsilon-lactone hydrolase
MTLVQGFVAWAVHHPFRSQITVWARRLSRHFDVRMKEVDGFRLLTMQRSPATNLHIVFFHGGAYVLDVSPMHWQLMKYLVNELRCKVTYVDYPLAPEHTAAATKKLVRAAYLDIAARYPDDRICLFGDSAGGGLALALRQLIRDEAINPIPEKTICCSPWLDISMTCSDYTQQAQRDKLLTRTVLVEAGQLYAGAGSTKDPFVSPIYGDLHGLGDIFVCVGMSELLLPDVRLLRQKAADAPGTTLIVVEQPKTGHDYLLNVRSHASQATFKAMKDFLGLA